jgi:serine/threonine-protein kinase
MAMTFESLVNELLLRWEEQPSLTPEELCQEYAGWPEHAALLEAVRRGMRELQASARFLSLAPAASDTVQTTPCAEDDRTEQALTARAGRYLLEEEIAAGGMGRVLRARDPDLHRPLAVKVLREDHRGWAELEQRFREEAQITGQLQHPGIPPVHEVGVLHDGRPFFAMKLVKGQTLAQLLARRASPAEDLPRFLTIFEQVCQTVAYAHARGVIHRDLKPSNVMVGAFGEVQVMDWGLAKVLTRGDGKQEGPLGGLAEESTVIRTARSGADLSRAGSVLGTPAFMPPEQANGEGDWLDERADVFGLGAILSVVLTGRPPYAGSVEEVVRRAAEGDLAEAFARLDSCGADGEMVQLCKDCLAARAGDRPHDAGEVAARVAAYRAGVQERLQAAEVARAAAQGRAEEASAKAAAERRARRLTLALASALLLLAAGGAGAGFWVQRQAAQRREEAARQEADLRRAVEASLDRVAALQSQARWVEAGAFLEQARSRLGDAGPEDLRRRTEQATADLRLVGLLDAARFKSSRIAGKGNYDFAAAEQDYERAFRDAGLGEAGGDTVAVAAFVRASAVREQLVAALDDWARVTGNVGRRAWLLQAARLADPDPWRDRFRDPALWADRQQLERLAGAAPVADLSPQLLTVLAGALQLVRADPVPLLTASQARHPGDFWLNFALGNALARANRPEDAAGYFRAALAVRPGTALVHSELGATLYARGRLGEALAEFSRAIALDPGLALAHLNLGMTLMDLGRPVEALAALEKALELDADLAPAHAGRAAVLRGQGRTDEALAACRKALELDADLALARLNLGAVLLDRDEVDAAAAELRKAIALDAAGSPVRVLPKGSIRALAHSNLGIALCRKGDADGGIAEHRQAVAFDPTLALTHANLALTLLQFGRFDEARAALQACAARVPAGHSSRRPAAAILQHCEYLLALEPKLPAVVRGESLPASALEGFNYALLCMYQRHYRVAARLWAEAFAAEPLRAADPARSYRYNAACSAALAGSGQGTDSDQLGDKERADLRKQALDWLRADLAQRTKQADSNKPQERKSLQQRMKHWQTDADLAGVRDKEALARLPAEEQEAWRKLWDDVSAVLKRASEPR